MKTSMYILGIIALALLFTLPTTHVQAQIPGELGGVNQATIDANPRFPEPGELVELNLNAYTLDTRGSSIRWFIDGVEDTSAVNERTLSVRAAGLGEVSQVTVQLSLASGLTLPITYQLVPGRVDVLIEADTLTPVFYKGRALPSIGSEVRAIAIPNFGDDVQPGEYSYRWQVDDDVLFGGSVKGKSIVTFRAPFARESFLTVDVIDPSGVTVTSESLIIPYVEPELYFYPDNPLRGMSRLAIDTQYQLLGSEIDVRAEPMYMDSTIFNQSPLLEWSIDGKRVINPSEDPQSITLQNAGGSGEFNIRFHIRNLQQLLQGVEDEFTLSF